VVSSASSNVSGARMEGRALGKHGFAGAGRSDHQNVVAARRGNFERALGRLLARTSLKSTLKCCNSPSKLLCIHPVWLALDDADNRTVQQIQNIIREKTG